MYELLYNNIIKKVDLTREEFEEVKPFYTPKKLKRKQFLLQEGDVCKYTAFVCDGCLRSYTVDADGNEHILQFAIANWFISDMNSFLTGEPATQFIDAIADSTLLLCNRIDSDIMMKKVPKMETYFRILGQHHIVAAQKRLSSTIMHTAEQKYLDFIKRYADISQHVPQHMIASYLGISPETLSRVRKQFSEKQ